MSYSIPIPQSIGDPGQKVKLQPLDQKQPPPIHNYYPYITNISTEPRPDGSQSVYVQTFLIDAITPNKKGWKVSYDNPADFDRRVEESMNHPLVLFPTADKSGNLIYDHPVAPITSIEAAADPVRANIEYQKKFTIGYARFFKKLKDGVWAATYEITNPKAKRFFVNAQKKGIKLYTSPYIVRPSSEPDRNNIHEWALIHNAIVSQPAFGDIATIKDVCVAAKGDPYTCQSLFASLTVKEEDPDFDVEAALELVTSQSMPNPHYENMTESASNTILTQPNPAEAIVETKTVPQSQIQDFKPNSSSSSRLSTEKEEQQEQKQDDQQQQQQNDPTKEPNKQSELDTLKAQLEALTKQNQTLQQKYEFDTRKAQIEKIFGPIVGHVYANQKTGEIDEKEYNSEINRLTKSNFTLDEIQELAQARYVIAQYQTQQQQQQGHKKPERASITSHVDEGHAFNYTKMNTDKDNCECPKTLGFSVFKKVYGGLF